MKLIYYSTAYFATHGGSNHSRQFFTETQKNPNVTEMLLFPGESAKTVSRSSDGRLSVRSAIRKIPFLQVVFFYRRNKFYFDQLVEFIRKERPDAIIMRLDSNFLQINRLRKQFPSLVITTEVNASPFDESFRNIAFKSFFRSLERRYLSMADLNFFVSNNLRKGVMGSRMRDERDRVVHNGVDPAKFRPMNSRALRKKYGFSDRHVVLGYIGTLDRHKRVAVLLESFKAVATQFNNAKLLIVGGGSDLEYLRQLSDSLGLNDHIIFTGLLPHSEIPGHINCLDIAIHHKAGEYMSPLKIFEYMACGVPVIGPATAAVKEVFNDEVHLLLCNGTVPDLTNKLMRLLADVAFRKKLGDSGKELVTRNFTWKANADIIVSSILSKKNSQV